MQLPRPAVRIDRAPASSVAEVKEEEAAVEVEECAAEAELTVKDSQSEA